jgi:ribonuclease HI
MQAMSIQIYTDGSCLGNPGPGAWAFVLRVDGKEVRKKEGEPYTTNNRMELMAVIEALKYATEHHPDERNFDVYSDSTWVISTLTKNWKRKKNLDLWEMLTPYLFDKKSPELGAPTTAQGKRRLRCACPELSAKINLSKWTRLTNCQESTLFEKNSGRPV